MYNLLITMDQSLKTTILHQFSGHGNHIVLTFDYHIPRFYALFEYDLHVASPTITLYINKRRQLLYHGFRCGNFAYTRTAQIP